MKNDRGEKKKKNSQLIQWIAFAFIISSVAFSGFSLWKVHKLQSEVTLHENAIETINAIYQPILDIYDTVEEFDRTIIELDYYVNELVNIGSMTVGEADANIQATVTAYRTNLRGDYFAIDQILKAYGLDEDLTALEVISPGISNMFNNGTSRLLQFYWANPDYVTMGPYTNYEFFTYFDNDVISTLTYAGMLDLVYPNTASILNSTFWTVASPPYTVGYAVQKMSLYVRESHTIPLLQNQKQIQGYILGNGINAVAVLVLGFVADFENKLLLKIISLVIAVGLLGFSTYSVIFL